MLTITLTYIHQFTRYPRAGSRSRGLVKIDQLEKTLDVTQLSFERLCVFKFDR